MLKEDLLSLQWEEAAANPLICPPFLSWFVADPTFLPPAATPDGKWHLFAHSLRGVNHFVSTDGYAWTRRRGLVVSLGIRPFLFQEARRYYLFYEKILKLVPQYHSRIEVIASDDLEHWSAPAVVLTPTLAWHCEGARQGAMGNPCVVAAEEGFRLYYSAGLVPLKDCGFSEPKYIGVAFSRQLTASYTALPKPVLHPEATDPQANMGAGAIKVVRFQDGYVGFQNGIYWDGARAHTGSAIRLLASADGIEWTVARPEPIVKPATGWKRAFVYALDVRFVDAQWLLYFNARDGWRWGQECIGRAATRAPG